MDGARWAGFRSLHFFVSLLAATTFFVVWSFADEQYFTTWALFAYGTYFFTAAVIRVFLTANLKSAFVDKITSFVVNGQFARWVFAPSLVVSLSVAVTVLYILYASWGQAWEMYCEGRALTCRDLILEFVVAHYLPPVALLLAGIMDKDLLLNPVRQKRGDRHPPRECFTGDNKTRYSAILFQVSCIPTSIYSLFYNPEVVYGANDLIMTVVFSLTAALVSISLGGFIGSI